MQMVVKSEHVNVHENSWWNAARQPFWNTLVTHTTSTGALHLASHLRRQRGLPFRECRSAAAWTLRRPQVPPRVTAAHISGSSGDCRRGGRAGAAAFTSSPPSAPPPPPPPLRLAASARSASRPGPSRDAAALVPSPAQGPAPPPTSSPLPPASPRPAAGQIAVRLYILEFMLHWCLRTPKAPLLVVAARVAATCCRPDKSGPHCCITATCFLGLTLHTGKDFPTCTSWQVSLVINLGRFSLSYSVLLFLGNHTPLNLKCTHLPAPRSLSMSSGLPSAGAAHWRLLPRRPPLPRPPRRPPPRQPRTQSALSWRPGH